MVFNALVFFSGLKSGGISVQPRLTFSCSRIMLVYFTIWFNCFTMQFIVKCIGSEDLKCLKLLSSLVYFPKI